MFGFTLCLVWGVRCCLWLLLGGLDVGFLVGFCSCCSWWHSLVGWCFSICDLRVGFDGFVCLLCSVVAVVMVVVVVVDGCY